MPVHLIRTPHRMSRAKLALLATIADIVIPGSRKDALGRAVLAENVGEPEEQ